MATMATFDPGRVLMGQPSSTRPYLQNPDTKPGTWPGLNGSSGNMVANGGPQQVPVQQPQPWPSAASESVRATGSGPFDAAYRQNLATYSGGQFARPGGNLSFNPTDSSTFPGNPTGAGNAPLPGLPDSLISLALGGNPFSFSPPQPVADTIGDNQPELPDWRFWLRQLRDGGSGFALPTVQ